jgi:hypothetical protein
MRTASGEKWIEEAGNSFRDGRLLRDTKDAVNWDTHALLLVMASQWSSVFSKKPDKAERSLVEDLTRLATGNDAATAESL